MALSKPNMALSKPNSFNQSFFHYLHLNYYIFLCVSTNVHFPCTI